ncbi:MAG: hypothetical protein HP496_13465 [Nitrospira sp.]|nr:hypothetical protein [Nitrospira sp.]
MKGAGILSNDGMSDWLPDMKLFAYGMAWWRGTCPYMKDVRNNRYTMCEAQQEVVGQQRTLHIETGGILVDSREVRK